LSAGALKALAVLLLTAAIGCTVSTLVGETPDAGGGNVCDSTCSCSTDGGCDYVCAPQLCPLGCSVDTCRQVCDGGVCGLSCELNAPCNPSCSTPLLQLQCTPSSEHIDCQVTCDAPTPWTHSCRGGACTVSCGTAGPATVCDGGVATCSASCPP
jgi:hypothetical protein